MNKENKLIVFQDICARLPYGVKCKFTGIQTPVKVTKIDTDIGMICGTGDDGKDYAVFNGSYKPYLFPISSMTEEQEKDYNTCHLYYITKIDWLNAHLFDYQGLIEKRLAIDATGKNIY